MGRFIVGDVFRLRAGDSGYGYFHYVAVDETSLGSAVIKVFKGTDDGSSAVPAIVERPVEFYAHVFLRVGAKMSAWEKVGHSKRFEPVDVWFKSTPDDPKVAISQNWYIWKVGQPWKHVGVLSAPYRDAELGIVVAPPDIADRLLTGSYHFVFPR